MLYDPKQPATEAKPPRYAIVQNDGTFKFGQGGVPPGSYVALFAELQRGRPGSFRGPDLLKNLYNDPDKNQNVENFKVEIPRLRQDAELQPRSRGQGRSHPSRRTFDRAVFRAAAIIGLFGSA